MIRLKANEVWAFDAEWIPDPDAGRTLYDLSDDLSDLEVMKEMWARGGATAEQPRPYLKTLHCRVVSISAVLRKRKPDSQHPLELRSLPGDVSDPLQTTERSILSTFLGAIGARKPQIVGFNSLESDLRIFVQRSVVHGLHLPEFCERPAKKFDDGPDYFSKFNEYSLDIRNLLASWGQTNFPLNDLAKLSGVPGKFKNSGDDVAELWLAGKLADIVAYNEFDALTTYLVWLRVAQFAGLFSPEEFQREEQLVRDLIARLSTEERYAHLKDYQLEWDRLRGRKREV